MERTRTYSWGDPAAMHDASRGRSGLDYLRLLASDALGRTPMLATLGYRFVAVDEGYVEFECDPSEFMYNPIGVVHGGLAATMLDSAASCAISTTLPAGIGYTTLELSAHFLRPVLSDLGPIRAKGTAISRGRRTAFGTAELKDGSNRLLAHASTSCLLFPTDAESSDCT